jgi:hypothetical protein
MSERITLIGLVGQAGTGKDTVAGLLSYHYGFLVEAFADPIRAMVRTVLRGHQLPEAALTERALKEQPLPHVDISPRVLMQQLGEAWRRADENVWVKLLALRCGLHSASACQVHDRIVIADVRYRNEASWIRQRGGKLLRVIRDVPAVAAHESEQQFGYIACHATILNDGTLDDLPRKLDEALHASRVDLSRRNGSTLAWHDTAGSGLDGTTFRRCDED